GRVALLLDSWFGSLLSNIFNTLPRFHLDRITQISSKAQNLPKNQAGRSNRTYSSLLDPLLITLAHQNALHVNPRRVDVIRIKLTRLHKFLNFGDRNGTRRRHDRIEVSGRRTKNQISMTIALPR